MDLLDTSPRPGGEAPRRLRSLLFTPGDRPERMRKALGCGADALILDLEDSVAPAAKARARLEVANVLSEAERGGVQLFVRVNPLGGEWTSQDLDAVLPARPDGLVLPKAEGPASVRALDALLRERGEAAPLILPIATETPQAIFRLGDYGEVSDRLAGLTWGAEDLPAAIGAVTSRLPDGGYTAAYETVRTLALFAGAAAGVTPIETVYPAIRDLEGLRAYAERGARDGFVGQMALHPDQVPVINAAYTPSPEAVAQARAVVEAFAAAPGAGVLLLDGRMVDAPHLRQAERLLARL